MKLDLGDLPSHIAADQQPTVEHPQRLRRARTQLLLSARGRTLGRKPEWRPLGRLLWVPIALAAALAIALTVPRLRDAPLTFGIDNGGAAQVGKPLQVPATAPMTLQFSDGTALLLAPGSKVRIAEVGAQGAGVVLEDGALGARVVHRDRSRWLVHAGPYRVVVTGTHFDVRWDAGQHSFTLALHEGAVTVFGPSLDASGKRVLPSETLRLGSPLGAEAKSLPSRPLEAAATGEVSKPSVLPPASATAEPPPRPSLPSAPSAPAQASWKSLAAAGNYAAAFAAAEKEGFRSICRNASSGDLLLLGNTARLAKKVAQAEEAFQAARARPGAAHQRAVAAFQLGRLAQDTRGDHARGATWFELYLNEAPDGPLAREAAGRVMEAHHRAGNGAAARLAARRYLNRYPGGPYESLARKLFLPP